MSGTLELFAEGIWTLARPQRFWGIETGTRMTVVRLGSGGLFVHCPVALDHATRQALDALGPVEAVVAPSLFHHLYVGDYLRAYPRAEFWCCPGLERKRSDLAWTGVLGDSSRDVWKQDLEQAPLTARIEREVVFFHGATRTFLCADALLNLGRHPSRLTRSVAWAMGNDGPGKGHLERFLVRDHVLGRRQIERILRWDVDGIVLAHGETVPRGGRAAIADAYRFLTP
ncbi:MAG: DUF4336 domain-containing protein [Polyangiaceae bacterium]